MQTPVGEFSLYRKPGRRNSITAKAESWEEWSLILDDQEVMTVEDAAAPWLPLRKRMRTGIHGQLAGLKFQAHAKRSLIPGKRTVHFIFDDHSLRFTVEGMSKVLYRENSIGSRMVAKYHRREWQTQEENIAVTALICFHTVTGLDVFLESPLWDIPPF
ncbi:conserved hypothetical protein [Streptomyces misionensis JCM 4497]